MTAKSKTLIVYKGIDDEPVFCYEENLHPEVIDCGHYFTVFYNGENEDGEPALCECDYPAADYYYEWEDVVIKDAV